MSVILVIIFLSLLVLVHELGHFLSAKFFGVKVEEFGFGFPPKITGIKKGGTTYSLNLLPLGGFVKIFGENGDDLNLKRKDSFNAQPTWRKSVIIGAGVIMNLILAWLILGIVIAVGTPLKVIVTSVAPNSPASEAIIKPGDSISEIILNDKIIKTETSKIFLDAINNNLDKDIALRIVSESGDEETKKVSPRSRPPKGEGPLGITIAESGVKKEPLPVNFFKSALIVGEETGLAFKGFFGVVKGLIIGDGSISKITGPVGIFTFAEQTSKKGILPLMYFAAIISINLAVLNIIPIPALDGGRLLFIIIEKIRKKSLSFRFQAIANAIGFIALLTLIIIVTIKDIGKFIL